MGTCRTACCTGWPVSFSLEDYFKLINEDCSPSLRDRIDRGVRPVLDPSPDRYAEIVPRYDGDCPMRLGNGRCAIHAELGERALSEVCRLYPRGIRKEPEGYEISCANSCEGVLELLFKRRAPLAFVEKELTLPLPPLGGRSFFFDTLGHEREIRLSFIACMQDRSLTIPERLMTLEKRLLEAENLMKRKDEAALAEWLSMPGEKVRSLPEVSAGHLEEGLAIAEKLVALIDERSASVREYGAEALSYFNGGEDAFARYKAAEAAFEKAFPDWEIRFEHMLVNHMFFSCFPFEDRPEDMHSEFMAVGAVYTLLRFLSIGYTASHGREEDFTDVCAAAFRLIDHTAFDIYVSHLLEDLGWTTDREMLEWIIL